MRDINAPFPDTAFWQAYAGRFEGLLKWQDFDALLDRLGAAGGEWYVFDPAGDAPESPCRDLGATLDEVRACVDPARNRSYCGAAFTDDRADPGFVKIFDPFKMGSACGGSADRVLPRWIISRLKPDPLPLLPDQSEKKRFFARLTG